MSRIPRLAIVAHDGKKADLVAFATFNRDRLAEFQLIATSSTGKLLKEKVGLEVEYVESGPLGGDVQIASRVVVGDSAGVIIMVDPLYRQPHEPVIQMLLRICNACTVPLAPH